MIQDRLRVFVSSKMAELAAERQSIKEALDALGLDAWVFEQDAGARSATIQETYLAELEAADLYVGVFWRSLGERTVEEFEHARSLGKDCLLYEKRSDIAGRDPALQVFLDRLGDVERGLTLRWFENPGELCAMVKTDAARWQAAIVRKFRAERSPAAPLPDRRERRALASLLRKVRHFWIDGVLERRMRGEGRLDVAKETRPDSVAHPWEAMLELPDAGPRIIGPERGITDVFDELEGSLLILGAAGSGKTTTLLALARDLVARAERDEAAPVPVVLLLSTWTAGQPLEEWIADELVSKYQLPRRSGAAWLADGRLALLLDGLDDLPDSLEEDCVRAINAFIREPGAPGLAVSCRLDRCEALELRLDLRGAVCLRPLDRERIEDYLKQGGAHLQALRDALSVDPVLLDLARSPLMLDLMTRVWTEESTPALPAGGPATAEEHRRRLLDAYVARMSRQPGGREESDAVSPTLGRLAWLARGMVSHRESIFLIERLQPGWLGTRAARGVFCVLVALALGAVATLFSAAFWLGGGGLAASDAAALSRDVHGAVSQGLLWRLAIQYPLWLLTLALIDRLLPRRGSRSPPPRPASVSSLIRIAVYALLWGLTWLVLRPADVTAALEAVDLMTGLVASVAAGLISSRTGFPGEIRTTEALGFSWSRAARGALWGVLGGLMVWAAFRTVWSEEPAIRFRWQSPDSEVQGFAFFLLALTVLGGVVGAILGGITGRMLDRRVLPNQGIRLSIRNALLAAAIAGPAMACTLLLIFLLLLPDPSRTLANGVALAIGTGALTSFCAALWFGAFDALKHYVLRAVFAATGALPWRLQRLLHHASHLNLLVPVGGGFVFVNGPLLEHFAAMDATTSDPGPEASETANAG